MPVCGGSSKVSHQRDLQSKLRHIFYTRNVFKLFSIAHRIFTVFIKTMCAMQSVIWCPLCIRCFLVDQHLQLFSVHNAYYHTNPPSHVPQPIYSWSTLMLNKQGKIFYSLVQGGLHMVEFWDGIGLGPNFKLLAFRDCLTSDLLTSQKKEVKKGLQ